ncbi:MAG: hypothetical protein RR521_12000 [Clostridia bacterium]
MNPIVKRILGELQAPDLLDRLERLSPSDCNSLWMEIHKRKAENRSPADVLKAYRSNRFVRPSELNPIRLCQLQSDLMRIANECGIRPVQLSPLAPLGSCAAFACVDQNKIVSAARGCEVLSDASNMLSLYLADEISSGRLDGTQSIHACSVDRTVRAQVFQGARTSAHFSLFCLVSCGRDSGSYQCEGELLDKQLAFYQDYFRMVQHATFSILLRKRSGYPDGDGFFAYVLRLLRERFPNLPITTEEAAMDNRYYQGVNFKMYMHVGEEKIEIGDGGFTDWMQRLLNNQKQRCLISGIGIDRLALMA